MRCLTPIVLVAALSGSARAGDPPKIDLKKGEIFIGRSEARVVEMRARVSGYLERVLVKAGAAVKKGDVLAEIDNRPYKLELDSSKARLAVAEAQMKLAGADLA